MAWIVRGNTDWNRPPWPGMIVTICMNNFITGSLGKKHRTNKPPPTRRIWERSKGDTTCLPTSRIFFAGIHLGCAMRVSSGKILCQNDWPETTETNPITIKPPRLWATWQSCSLGSPCPVALHLGASAQQSLLLRQHICLLGQLTSER